MDALFTAVSTICVAGLSTVDMATHWSPLGNAFVFIGTQIGAIGVLTLASVLGAIISGGLGLRAKLMIASVLAAGYPMEKSIWYSFYYAASSPS